MPEYRRRYLPGGTYFFTLVTASRARIFADERARLFLRQSLHECRKKRPFEIIAFVLLPDHLHTIWTLPSGDEDYSTRWGAIKAKFTSDWLEAGGNEQRVAASKQRRRQRGVWQPRFHEHTIRDGEDFEHHFHYSHYNPVKHGYCQCPYEWPYSTFHRYVSEGWYPREWCCGGNERQGWMDLSTTVGE